MTSHRTVVEFYGPGGELLTVVATSMVPTKGAFINIRKVTYQVSAVTYAVDHADHPEKSMRANVDLTPAAKHGSSK